MSTGDFPERTRNLKAIMSGVVVADTDFKQTDIATAPVRSWLFHFVVTGPNLDARAMARVLNAFLLAVDAQGATAGAGGGLAEIVGEQDHDTPHSN